MDRIGTKGIKTVRVSLYFITFSVSKPKLMDIFLILLSGLCLLIAYVGCVVPVLPGLPFAYIGMLLLQATDKVHFPALLLWGWLAIVVVAQVLDYFIPAWTARLFGSSQWGSRGCIAGGIAGFLFFPPWGIVIGPFIGAFIGELIDGNDAAQALKSGVGAFLGFITGTLFKLALCVYFSYYYITALLP